MYNNGQVFDVLHKSVRDALKKTGFKDIVPKGGRGPDQIPKFVVCEIGTWGGVGSQTLICPNFKTDLKTKGDL